MTHRAALSGNSQPTRQPLATRLYLGIMVGQSNISSMKQVILYLTAVLTVVLLCSQLSLTWLVLAIIDFTILDGKVIFYFNISIFHKSIN